MKLKENITIIHKWQPLSVTFYCRWNTLFPNPVYSKTYSFSSQRPLTLLLLKCNCTRAKTCKSIGILIYKTHSLLFCIPDWLLYCHTTNHNTGITLHSPENSFSSYFIKYSQHQKYSMQQPYNLMRFTFNVCINFCMQFLLWLNRWCFEIHTHRRLTGAVQTK